MATRDAATAAPPRFVGLPPESMADEAIAFRITGLEPDALVTLRARMQDESGWWWESATSFAADTDGTVDLGTQRPVAGSYDAADPMGFLWSMRPVPGDHVAAPFRRNTVDPSIIELSVERDGEPLGAATLTRRYVAPGVSATPVRDNGLLGTFFAPASGDPAPAVIVVGGSGGGLSESTAALLAAHGYPALALAYFRAEHLPADLVRIPLEYFETAFAWVQAQPAVAAGRLAVCGTSRGGELALLLGSRFPLIKAVIGYVPSGIVYGGLAGAGRESDQPQPAWTHGGEGIPFLGSRRDRGPAPVAASGEPFALTPGFLASLENEEQAAQAAIPVERIAGPVLLISGQADAMWPSALFSERVMERLAERQHPYPDQHLSYPDTGHMISPPFSPTTVADMRHPLTGGYFALGGTPAGTAFARADSWPKLLAFLESNLKTGGDR